MRKIRLAWLLVLLAVTAALPLTACKGSPPGGGKKKPAGTAIGSSRGDGGDETDGVNIEGAYDDSLDLLREEMGAAPSILFAAAFIGNAAGGPDTLEIPLSEWILAEDPGLCRKAIILTNFFPSGKRMGLFHRIWPKRRIEKVRQIKTLTSLLHTVEAGNHGILPVHTLHGDKVWKRFGDRVELHLGNGNIVICSEDVYQRVKHCLVPVGHQ